MKDLVEERNKRSVWEVEDHNELVIWLLKKHPKVAKEFLQLKKPDVWKVPTRAFKEAHFATFPPRLIEPCILAGCPEGGIALDPFGGSGTTGMVALENRRKAVLIELNPEYGEMQDRRTADVQMKIV